jgi:hypothetical protein
MLLQRPTTGLCHAAQSYYSEGEDGLEFFDKEFWATCYPGCRSCGVMMSSAVLFR